MLKSSTIEEHLVNHRLTKKLKKVQKLIDDAQWALLEAYQIVGEKSYENEKRKNPIHKVVFRRRKES